MAIIMSIAYSCAKDPKLVRSNARKKYSYQNIISPQKASYNIKYREKHSGILKQAIVQYDSREFWPCFISIEERVKITDIKAKKDKYYFNTFHISLAIINPKSMKIRRSAHESANKISIISKKTLSVRSQSQVLLSKQHSYSRYQINHRGRKSSLLKGQASAPIKHKICQ